MTRGFRVLRYRVGGSTQASFGVYGSFKRYAFQKWLSEDYYKGFVGVLNRGNYWDSN